MSSFYSQKVSNSSSSNSGQNQWYKYSLSYADFADVNDTKSLKLADFISGELLTGPVIIQVNTAFSGGPISDALLNVGIDYGADSNKFGTTNVFSPSPGVIALSGLVAIPYDLTADHDFTVTLQVIDGVCNDLTQGSLDIFVLVDTRLHALL